MICSASEVSVSGAVSASGDLYAFTLLVRAVIPFVAFPAIVEKVLSGDTQPALRELLGLFAWVNREILAKPRAERACIEEAWCQEQRAWSLLGLQPDRDGYQSFLQRHLVDPKRILCVDDQVSYVSIGGAKPVSLRTRRPLRRVLKGLVEQHGKMPERALSTLELSELGWSDERLRPDAAASRVYVALSSLRAFGLGEVIQRYDGGFGRHVRHLRFRAKAGHTWVSFRKPRFEHEGRAL